MGDPEDTLGWKGSFWSELYFRVVFEEGVSISLDLICAAVFWHVADSSAGYPPDFWQEQRECGLCVFARVCLTLFTCPCVFKCVSLPARAANLLPHFHKFFQLHTSATGCITGGFRLLSPLKPRPGSSNHPPCSLVISLSLFSLSMWFVLWEVFVYLSTLSDMFP